MFMNMFHVLFFVVAMQMAKPEAIYGAAPKLPAEAIYGETSLSNDL